MPERGRSIQLKGKQDWSVATPRRSLSNAVELQAEGKLSLTIRILEDHGFYRKRLSNSSAADTLQCFSGGDLAYMGVVFFLPVL